MSAVRLDNVTLYRRAQEEYSLDLKRHLFATLQGQHRKPLRRKVLDGVTLEIAAGEKIGIIGPNGAGKSTLLKIICGILEPTEGTVQVEGLVAPLLELGAGFDPELSAVDNIWLYAAILGRKPAEMAQKIDAIIEFAELGDYRDAPVRVFSSGMIARLGFAIATDIEPQIVLLDEVLSVGDESFRNKSRRRLESLWRDHVTVIAASHDLPFVRSSCDRVIWLERGRLRFAGSAQEAVDAYLGAAESSARSVLAESIARLT